MNKEKVYCKFCRNLKIKDNEIKGCYHGGNRGNWESPDVIALHPKHLNCDNACKWFEEKESENVTISDSLTRIEIYMKYFTENSLSPKECRALGVDVWESLEGGNRTVIRRQFAKTLLETIEKIADNVMVEREKRNI